MQSEPRSARTTVWALSVSLAATPRIDVSFFSSGYLDVSVHRVPSVWLWIHHTVHEVFSCGFPHSDISGSQPICGSPKLFAAYHVFHRLLVPRHPPCALLRFTKWSNLDLIATVIVSIRTIVSGPNRPSCVQDKISVSGPYLLSFQTDMVQLSFSCDIPGIALPGYIIYFHSL